jgi:hypothetical protein
VKRIAEMATGTGAATFTNGLSDYLRTTEYQNINGLPIDVTLQATPAVDLTTRERRLNELTLTSTSIASMLVNDNGRAAQWTDTVNTLWSTALTDNDVETGASVLDAELKAITDGVVPPQPYSFSLSGRRATIPVRITNTLSEPLQVVVRLSAAADKLTFPEGDQVALLAPDDVTEVQVPVVARTNGFFEVKVDVLTPRGNHQVASTSIRANVSALTGLAQVLTGAALLILLTWWVRNFRRSRRVRRGLQTLPSHPSAQPIKVAEEGPTDLEPAHAGDSSSGNGARNATPEVQPAATNGELPERDGTASATLSDS